MKPSSMKTIFYTFRKAISLVLITAFISSSLYLPQAQAGEMVMPIMPKPGTMVNLSPVYSPAFLKGIVIHPDNALKFDFLIHKGDGHLDQGQKQQEYNKLVKYFLASLTVPEADQWVNLSPYEHNRIIKDDFGKTVMGRDLLGQDYLLKQITASLMYPESGLGKTFWDKVYQRAYKEYGTTDIPVNTFNKVWIVPDEAYIYESGNTAYVVKSHLKVMLEEDYLSLKKHTAIYSVIPAKAGIQNRAHTIASKVIKEIILPEIEREVNEGKNFAMLRQVFSGMVLATWYKKALKESLLGQVYADKAKVLGVNQNPKNNEIIYHKYLIAFKKGVYNYIKEDVDKYTNEMIPRKYFSGGFDPSGLDRAQIVHVTPAQMNAAIKADNLNTLDRAIVAVVPARTAMVSKIADAAMNSHIPWEIGPEKLQRNIDALSRLVKRLEKDDRELPLVINLGDKHGNSVDLRKVYSMVSRYVGFSPIEVIINGDVFDRGINNRRNYDLLVSLIKLRDQGKIKLELLLGNHEEMLLNAYYARARKDKAVIELWLGHGGWQTLHDMEPGSPRADIYEPILRDEEKKEIERRFHRDYRPMVPKGIEREPPPKGWLERFWDVQYGYFVDKDTDLSELEKIVHLIEDDFDVVNVSGWDYSHKHTGVSFNLMGQPNMDLSRLQALQMEWEALRAQRHQVRTPEDIARINAKSEAFLKKAHHVFWVDQFQQLRNVFFEGREDTDMNKYLLEAYLAEVGTIGIVYAHEQHALKHSRLPGSFTPAMNIGSGIIGIDMADGLGGPGGIFYMDPDRGFVLETSDGKVENIYSKQELLATLKQRIETLEELKAEQAGQHGDEAMTTDNEKTNIVHLFDRKPKEQSTEKVEPEATPQSGLSLNYLLQTYGEIDSNPPDRQYYGVKLTDFASRWRKWILISGAGGAAIVLGYIAIIGVRSAIMHQGEVPETASTEQIGDMTVGLEKSGRIAIVSFDKGAGKEEIKIGVTTRKFHGEEFKVISMGQDSSGSGISFYLQSIKDKNRWVIISAKDGKQWENANPQIIDRSKRSENSKSEQIEPGGIDLNSANMNLFIKRDGRGVPLPIAQQDMAQLARIRGFVPRILDIEPVASLPLYNEVKQ